jgi:hypothetical protein
MGAGFAPLSSLCWLSRTEGPIKTAAEMATIRHTGGSVGVFRATPSGVWGINMVKLTGCSVLVLAASVLATPCSAQVELFKDQESLESAFRSSTPQGTACEQGGTFRKMYDDELAHCIYEGEESWFRLALTQKAVLVDIGQKSIGSDREQMFEDEVEYYLQKLDLLSMYEFSPRGDYEVYH